jgi:hypothetical protein
VKQLHHFTPMTLLVEIPHTKGLWYSFSVEQFDEKQGYLSYLVADEDTCKAFVDSQRNFRGPWLIGFPKSNQKFTFTIKTEPGTFRAQGVLVAARRTTGFWDSNQSVEICLQTDNSLFAMISQTHLCEQDSMTDKALEEFFEEELTEVNEETQSDS